MSLEQNSAWFVCLILMVTIQMVVSSLTENEQFSTSSPSITFKQETNVQENIKESTKITPFCESDALDEAERLIRIAKSKSDKLSVF